MKKINIGMIIEDHLKMEKIRNIDRSKILPIDFERVTGIPANTFSKLKWKIKKYANEKDEKRMHDYIDMYLFKKFIK